MTCLTVYSLSVEGPGLGLLAKHYYMMANMSDENGNLNQEGSTERSGERDVSSNPHPPHQWKDFQPVNFLEPTFA